MANKEDNARLLDPNRFKIAQQNAVMPGGPQNNNPMNVTDFAAPPIESDSIYGDHRQNYKQMGTGMVNPMMVGRSNVPALNVQPQPSPNSQEPMEGMRMGADAANRGLFSSPFMGITGSGALMPGAMDPTIPGQGAPLMKPMTTIDGMTPGSTPQKKQKKGKK